MHDHDTPSPAPAGNPPNPPYPALQRVLGALSIVALAGAGCWALLDAPLAWWVHDHALRRFGLLEALTHIPDVIVVGSVLVLLLTPLRLGLRAPPCAAERTALSASVAVACAVLVKDALKFVFGRAWPETWVRDNPSLIQDHVYGFFWFQHGAGFHSFPSGHTTVTFAAMSVLWLARPALRPVAALACAAVAAGLLGMDYHFLGDVLVGAALGAASGWYVHRAFARRPGC